MKRVILVFILLILSSHAYSQGLTSVRIERDPPDSFTGRLVARWNAREVIVSNYAIRSWQLGSNANTVFYSSLDGAGGFENEGQSLWRYDIDTGKRTKLVTDYFMINKVVSSPSRTGRRALLISMSDGGLGAPHVIIADPVRGAVWRYRLARFVGIRNGRAAVGLYRAHDIESDRVTRPYRILYVDLDTVLRRTASPYWPLGEGRRLPRITGSVLYRERIALPNNASVVIRLTDYSRTTPVEISRTTIRTAGRQVPVPFSLAYNPKPVISEGLYGINADIVIDGSVRFTTPERQYVITRGYPIRDIEVLVRRRSGEF
ncbi:MAG: YbaY family lipoprotein [Armatimonadota bacterium]